MAAGEFYVSDHIHRYRFSDEFPDGLHASQTCGKVSASWRKPIPVSGICCAGSWFFLSASLYACPDCFSGGCSDSWKLCFFYGSFCVSAEEGLPAGKNNSGDVSYRFCGGRDLSGAGNRRNHDRKNFSAFSGRNLWQSLHTDLCGRNFPAVPEKYLSGNPDISGEKTTVLRLF